VAPARYRALMELMHHSSSALEVRITCGDADEALRLAQAFINQRLAACVHQWPIESLYRWRGQLTADQEVVLGVTTVTARLSDILRTVEDLHSYELPAVTWAEIYCTPSYSAWIIEQTSDELE